MAWDVGAGLQDKGVIVTGAAGGIGSASARALAGAGARVCLVDVSADGLASVVAALPGGVERHCSLAVDLTDLGSHARIVATALERFGRIDHLAHIAAILRRAANIDLVTEADWDAQVDTNLKAAFFLNRAVAAAMRAAGRGGSITNFSSQGWWTGGFGGAVVYAASKGGIVSMSRGLARTLAPDGIRVNTIAPGAVDTSMLRSGMTEEALDDFVRTQIPMRRMAAPEEIAGVVVFLASDHASFISGSTINVSGAQLMY